MIGWFNDAALAIWIVLLKPLNLCSSSAQVAPWIACSHAHAYATQVDWRVSMTPLRLGRTYSTVETVGKGAQAMYKAGMYSLHHTLTACILGTCSRVGGSWNAGGPEGVHEATSAVQGLTACDSSS